MFVVHSPCKDLREFAVGVIVKSTSISPLRIASVRKAENTMLNRVTGASTHPCFTLPVTTKGWVHAFILLSGIHAIVKLSDLYFVNKFLVYFVNKLHVLFEISEMKSKVKLEEFESRLCKLLTVKCFYLLKNSPTLTQVCLSLCKHSTCALFL